MTSIGASDLSGEQRDELLDGLEADLAEQLADGGPLPDAGAYADELRAAAGLPSPVRRGLLAGRTSGRTPAATWGGAGRHLDRLSAWWPRAVGSRALTRQVWAFVVPMRPVWWVLRAWLAVTLVDQLFGAMGPEPLAVWPRLDLPLGRLMLPVALVLSVLIGQGRLWPGSGPGRRTSSRLVLAGLNTVGLLTVGVLTVVAMGNNGAVFGYFSPVTETGGAPYNLGYRDAQSMQGGLQLDGRPLRNLYPYDAQGLPLTGVQLFDGAGRPVALSPSQAVSGAGKGSPTRVVGCPWLNGTVRLYHVFPLPERPQPFRSCRTARDPDLGPAVLPVPPLAQVPPVVLAPAAP